MIQPHEIFAGAIVNINTVPIAITGIISPDPSKHVFFKDKWVVITPFSYVHLDKCEPIPLTEKILTEWCGFEKYNECFFKYKNIEGWYLATDGSLTKSLSEYYVRLPHLHHLQRLILALTNQPLKIELK